MLKKNLKVGDALIVKGNRVVIFTKKTKKYWYYLLDGRNCRISDANLWDYIDHENNYSKVHYGSCTKRRKNKRKGRKLDLHGVRHSEVEERVRKYLNFVELPTSIITGDSSKMKEEVLRIVEEYGWSTSTLPGSFGELIITEK